MPPFIGLSLHDNEIRFVKVKVAQRQRVVERTGIVKIPPGLFFDGKIQDAQGLADALKNMVDQAQLKACDAAIALPVSQVIHQSIQVDESLDELECELEIAENLSRYLPGTEGDLSYDYIRTHGSHDVMLVAARAQQIDDYLTVVQQSKLTITAVDVDIYALARAVISLGIAEQLTAVIDFDTASLQVIVLQRGKIIFHHRLIFSASNADYILQPLHELFSQMPKVEKVLLAGNIFLPIERLQKEIGMSAEIIAQCDHRCLVAFGLAMKGDQYARN